MKKHDTENQGLLPKELMPQETKERFLSRANYFREFLKDSKHLTGGELEVHTAVQLVTDTIPNEEFVDTFMKQAIACFSDHSINPDTFVDETVNYLLSVLKFPDTNMLLSGDLTKESQGFE